VSERHLLELVRGAAIATTKAVEALADGDVEEARELVGIADGYLVPALELLTTTRRAA